MIGSIQDKYSDYDYEPEEPIAPEIQVDRRLPAREDGPSSTNVDTNDSQEISKLHECMQARKHVVCKIMTYHQGSTKANGTGFMISHNLIMTNHHVLRNKEMAQNSYAIFEVFSEEASIKKSNRIHDYVSLFPQTEGGYFFSGAPGDADDSFIYTQEHLDYSIVAFKPSVNTARIARHSFSLFDSPTRAEDLQLKKDMNVAILHFPEIPCGESKLSGLLKIATGKIVELSTNEIYAQYNLPTDIGSSGSPIVRSNSNLAGIHCRGKILNKNKNFHKDSFFNGCIPKSKIIDHISEKTKNEIEEYSKKNLFSNNKNYHTSSRFDYSQIRAEDGHYIERTSHLQEIVSLFNTIYPRKEHLRKMTLAGGPGMGKKFLATRLALQMASQFSVILFLQQDNYEETKAFLLDRARDLLTNIGNPELEKIAIRSYLRDEELPYLLVLDGKGGYETYEKLNLFLPFENHNKFILATSQKRSLHSNDSNYYYVQSFNLNESIQYIKKIAPALKSENENLIQFLKKLNDKASNKEKLTLFLEILRHMHSDDERLIELLNILFLDKNSTKNKLGQLLELLNKISEYRPLNSEPVQDEKLKQLLDDLEKISPIDKESLSKELETIILKNNRLKKILNKLDGIPSAIKSAGISLTGYCENSTEKLLKSLKENGAKVLDLKDLTQSEDRTIPEDRMIIEQWKEALNALKKIRPLALDILYLCAFLKKGTIEDELIINSCMSKHPLAGNDDYKKAILILKEYSMISKVNTSSEIAPSCFSIPRCVRDIIEFLIPTEEKQSYFILAAQALARFIKPSMNVEDSDFYVVSQDKLKDNLPLKKLTKHQEWKKAFRTVGEDERLEEILDLILKEKEDQVATASPTINPMISWTMGLGLRLTNFSSPFGNSRT